MDEDFDYEQEYIDAITYIWNNPKVKDKYTLAIMVAAQQYVKQTGINIANMTAKELIDYMIENP